MNVALRIVHVSDSHLSVDVPFANEHWDAVVAHVEATQPDLVIHTGDVSINGADLRADLEHSRRRLDELTVPWLVLPGNHDIGDADEPDQPVDDERRTRWAELFGDLNWARDEGAWHLVGVDCQTLATASPAAEELWAWLASELASARPTALFLHRPLRPWGDAFDEPRRYVVEPHRARLTALIEAGDVRLVASGHLHQHLVTVRAGVTHVWAPSTWAVIPDYVQPIIAAKQTGVIELVLHPDGAVDATYVRPVGIADVVIGDAFPSPYGH